MPKAPSRLSAILQAVFVTFLWSTSWVLIKIGLRSDLPALTFAGLRYFAAFLCLIPFVMGNASERAIMKNLSRADWRRLAILGLFYYTLTQGAVFVSLAYLPAVVVNLMLNLTAIPIAVAGIFYLREIPSTLQWVGATLAVIGVGAYFLPMNFSQVQLLGLIATLVCVLANAVAVLLGREVNREGRLSPLTVTFISMGIGATLMLVIGLITQRVGALTWQEWGIIAWLAVVNTAFAFTIWNHTLRTLSAVESSILNSLMMPQIAILAFLFLDETLTAKEIVGLILVGVGVLVVQLQKR
ncbi:MAG: DMT family transporter [Chloroflexota bacterium]